MTLTDERIEAFIPGGAPTLKERMEVAMGLHDKAEALDLEDTSPERRAVRILVADYLLIESVKPPPEEEGMGTELEGGLPPAFYKALALVVAFGLGCLAGGLVW